MSRHGLPPSLSVLRYVGELRRLLLADYLRPRGTAPDKVIHKPEELGAQPTRYRPSPTEPVRGKRRRQWR